VRLAATLLMVLAAGPAAAAAPPCPGAAPVALRVRVGAVETIAVLQTGDAARQLQLVRPGDGTSLWSTGTGPGASQHLFASSTRFAGSLAAIDTDSDRLHDRLYAGDLSGRLWRVDLANGQPAESFAHAALLADLGSPDGTRGLQAPADVWRTQTATGEQLVLVIGTAGPGQHNQLHVLFDTLPGDAAADTREPPRGHSFGLAGREILVAPITVQGRTTLAAARRHDAPGCQGEVAVATFTAAPAEAGAPPTTLSWEVLGNLPADAPFTVSVEQAGNWLACRLAGHAIAACSTAVPVVERFWRREDAD